MLFCLAWVFNFLIGGISGVFLSDVPSDVTTHGSFFSMAHFHYTIMGGLVFTLFAGIYYWGPKMTGFKFNERLARSTSGRCSSRSTRHSRRCSRWLARHAAAGRDISDQPAGAQRLGVGVGVRDRLSMLVFLVTWLVAAVRA